MFSAAARLVARPSQPMATSCEDRLSVTMSFIRAAERHDMHRAREDAGRYKHIRDTIGEVLDRDDIRGNPGLQLLKQHAVVLAQALQQENAARLEERRSLHTRMLRNIFGGAFSV